MSEEISFGWAAALIEGMQVELTPERLERRRLADAMRRMSHALLATQPSIEVLRATADEIDSLTGRLSVGPASRYEGFAEAANAPKAGWFLDRSPVVGQANPLAPPLELSFGENLVTGTVTFGPAHEGAPGCVHGGWVAAAFDEVLGAAQSFSGSGGMTAYLKVDYRRPTPLHQELCFEGEVTGTSGRKIHTVGRCLADGVLTAEAEGLFISIEMSRFAELLSERDADAGER